MGLRTGTSSDSSTLCLLQGEWRLYPMIYAYMQTVVHVGKDNMGKGRTRNGKYKWMRKDWVQVMNRSYKRDWTANCFPASITVFFCWLVLVMADMCIKHTQYCKTLCETSQLPFQMPILTVLSSLNCIHIGSS